MVASTGAAVVNQAAFAKLAGVSRKTVTKWKSQGFLVLTADGQVDVEKSRAILTDRGFGNFDAVTQVTGGVTSATGAQDDDTPDGCQPQDDEIAAALIRSGGVSLLTHGEAERMKENFLALKQRLAYEREAGSLVSKAEVEARFAERWTVERTAWENRPSAVAAVMGKRHGIDTVKMRIILEEFVEEHLRERVAEEERRRGLH